MLLQVPRDVKMLELPTATMWVDEEGILYSVGKTVGNVNTPTDEIKFLMEQVREFIGNKKICMIVESGSRTNAPPKEEREIIAAQLNSIAKAMAIVSTSPLNRMVANLFFSFKPPEYPVKMFSNVEEARQWIRRFL